MRIYISGGITGVENYREKFDTCRRVLADLYPEAEIIDPSEILSLLPETLTWEEYMNISMEILKVCDTICMMQKWKYSKGASKEYEYAIEHNYKMLMQVPE